MTWKRQYNTPERRAAMNARAAERRAQGLCANCDEPARAGRINCVRCAARVSQGIVRRSRDAKVRAIEYLGGICVDCERRFDEPEVYDFHHGDAASKRAKVTDLLLMPWDVLVTELTKCVLLCANCHRMRHARERASRLTKLHESRVSLQRGDGESPP